MHIRSMIAAGGAALTLSLAAIAAPASAATIVYDLGGSALSAVATTAHYPGSPNGIVALDVTAYTFQFNPNAMEAAGHGVDDFTLTRLTRDANGLGICNNAADNCTTVDNAGNGQDRNEALALVFAEAVKLNSITISGFATNSTFTLWGQNNSGNLVSLFTLAPIVGASPLTIDLSSLTGTNTTYALTASGGSDNGFHVNQINASTGAIPEPATWALMIMGFGGAGAMLRRRRFAYA